MSKRKVPYLLLASLTAISLAACGGDAEAGRGGYTVGAGTSGEIAAAMSMWMRR